MTEELTIQLFFFSSALLAGFEAMKAGGWRVWAFGGLTALLAIFGLAWHSLKEIYPPLTIWVTEIATSPQSWFALIVIALVLIAMTGRRGSAWARIQRLFGAPTTPSEEAASANGELEELKARLAEAEHRITKNDSALDMIRTAQGEIELGLVNARTNLVLNNQKLSWLVSYVPTIMDILCNHLALSALFNAIPEPPQFTSELFELTRKNMTEEQKAADQYCNDVKHSLAETQWATDVRSIIINADGDGEQALRQVPEDRRPDIIDTLDLRSYMISKSRCEGLQSYIKSQRRESFDRYRSFLFMLRERIQALKSIK